MHRLIKHQSFVINKTLKIHIWHGSVKGAAGFTNRGDLTHHIFLHLIFVIGQKLTLGAFACPTNVNVY